MSALACSISAICPMCTPSSLIRRGNCRRISRIPTSIPVRCEICVTAHRVTAFCVNGVYSMRSTAVGTSSAVARSMPAHRVSLLKLMFHTLGYDNVRGEGIVRENASLSDGNGNFCISLYIAFRLGVESLCWIYGRNIASSRRCNCFIAMAVWFLRDDVDVSSRWRCSVYKELRAFEYMYCEFSGWKCVTAFASSGELFS